MQKHQLAGPGVTHATGPKPYMTVWKYEKYAAIVKEETVTQRPEHLKDMVENAAFFDLFEGSQEQGSRPHCTCMCVSCGWKHGCVQTRLQVVGVQVSLTPAFPLLLCLPGHLWKAKAKGKNEWAGDGMYAETKYELARKIYARSLNPPPACFPIIQPFLECFCLL